MTTIPMNKNKLRKQKWYNYAVAILIGVVGYVVLTNLGVITGSIQSILSKFTAIFLGCALAYLVHPLASALQKRLFGKIENKNIGWALSVVLSMILVILVLTVLLLMLVPQLIESTLLLIGNMDSYIAQLNRLVENLNIGTLDFGNELQSMMASSEDIIKTASQFLGTSLRKIASTSADIGKNVFNWLIAFILSIYLLMAKENIKSASSRLLRALMPEKWYEIVVHFMRRCNYILVRYIVYSLLDAVIVGGATALFMAITQMQYIGLIAFVCGITNLIPSFGPVIGGAIGAFILLLINPWHALMFIIFAAVLQTLDGYVIKPKLFGDSLGVSGLLILISIVLFGNIFGIVGILLAIPLAAIFDFVYQEGILPLLEARRARLDAEERAEEEAGVRDLQMNSTITVLTEMSEGGKKRK